MKKILCIVIVTAMMLCTACSRKEKDDRVLSDIVQGFEDSGMEISGEDKPYFELIGAVDGIMFYIGNGVVKIYEYESIDKLKDAKEEYESIKDWPSNGKFLLETKSEDAIKAFNEM